METTHLKKEFLLDPEVTFLNFGSFGACPKPVFEDYLNFERELERQPVQFITVNGPEYLRRSRQALGKFINCHEDDVVYVPNPSFAMNIVARCLPLREGDEVLSTNIEYGACDRIFKYHCSQKGAVYVRIPITLPVTTKEKFISDFFSGISVRTKAIFIGQITSSTALILPVKEICEIAKQKGLITIVDGAHVPGHIPFDLQEIKADYYTGACHKWMLTPKGCSFLYVKRELQKDLDPLVVSWGYESASPSQSQFLDYHQMQGTRDFSAFLTVPRAIEFMKEHQWTQVSAHYKKMVLDNAERFCSLLETQPLAPLTSEWIPQMLSIKVNTEQPEKLQQHLYQTYRIEIPVMRLNDNCFMRFSLNAFNTQSDLDKLYDTLRKIIAEGKFIKVKKEISL
jgi:isopenicillin-N epimerase